MEKITVMVTGVGGGGHGEQIFKALRMSSLNCVIIGCDMSPASFWLAKADKPFVLPPANSSEYVDKLLELCRQHGVKALFHGSEPELKVMSRERERIEAAGIFLPINPTEVIDLCMDKSRTMRFLVENGFDCPRSVKVAGMDDALKINFLPVVLKPSIGGGGSANIYLAQTFEEVRVFASYLLSLYKEFIAQEYVGTCDSEYTVGVLCSMDGKLLNSIAVKKNILSGLSNRIKVPNRTGRAELGPSLAISSGVSQGSIGRYPEVTETCQRIALSLGARGPLNIQCRLVNGKVFVFEINPRFSGTTSLRAMVGYNEPDVLLRKHLLGEYITPFWNYREGTILRGLQEFFVEKTDSLPSKQV